MTAVLTFGGIYAASTFHWGPIEMLIYGIELSIFAVLGGFVGGWLDNHLGSKRAIFVSIGGTAVFGLVVLTIAPDRIFWFIPYDPHAAPVWSLPFFRTWPELIYLGLVNFIAVLITAGYANSRTMLARIAPTSKMTEFFGLYSLSGTSTTFLATGFVGWLTAVSQSQRIGLLGETLFLVIGLTLMIFVKERREADA
jgi:UMF1 family MFS transporter